LLGLTYEKHPTARFRGRTRRMFVFRPTIKIRSAILQVRPEPATCFAQHVETRQLYAIKVFSVFDREKRAQLLKEVETLWGMECPSLINFVGGYLKVPASTIRF